MRYILSLLTFGAAALMMRSLNAQSVDPSASSPYGGPPITFGELAASSGSGSLTPSTSSICQTGTNPNCVVTGQYSRGRLGQNALEQTLAGYNTTTNPLPNTFTWINYYATNSNDYYHPTPTTGATYNPTMAQPLWLNNVPISGTDHNVLLTATLTGSVYAYDADNGAILWDRYSGSSAGPPLVQNCGGASGTPVLPSFQSIPYYGILSTPVVEGETTHPVMFVVSGCQNSSGVVSYYLNAIDITTGGDLMSGGGTAGGIQIVGPSGVFRPGNQFQRPALLLNHTKNAMGQTTGTYLYIGFGTGITELGSGTKGYNGWIFGYSIAYTGTQPTAVSATALTNSPFSTTPSEATSGVYPPTSAAAPGWAGSPAANPSCNTSSNCFNGDNWVDGTNVTGHAGGVWMSGRGPSSDASADVYFGAGNGTFGCTTSGTTCTSVSTVNNFGESAVEFAAPLASSPSISVADFYAPYTNTVANDQPANGSPFSAASTQAQALNRYDLDFGDPGVISFVTQVSSGRLGLPLPTKPATFMSCLL